MSIDRPFQMRHWLVRSRAWLSVLILTPFGLVALLSAPAVREGSWTDFLLNVAAWIAFLLGAAFRWWATLYIGGRKHLQLVVSGPYDICRNPLYFGTFLLTLSIALFVPSLVFALGVLLAAPFYLAITVSWEEARLRETFGEVFEAYCRQVPRFFPRLPRRPAPETLIVQVDGLRAELRRTLYWMWIPLLSQTVGHLRAAPWWPHWPG